MTILPKKVVQELAAYDAPEEQRANYVKLNFNENTVGFNSVLGEDLAKLGLNYYPEYDHLVASLAKALGVSPEQVTLTNGSDEGISVVANTFIEPGQDTAVVSDPCFTMIPLCLKVAGAKLDVVKVLDDMSFDVKGIEEALKRKPKLALLASPDNPTGAKLEPKTVINWCAKYPDTLFVIDEAYTEYSRETLITELPKYPNLLLLRTLSKAWGLAGLRIGIVIGDPKLITYMKVVKLPYSVNVAAVEAAKKIVGSVHLVHEAAQATMKRKVALLDELRKRGYQIVEGSGNFFLLRVGFNCSEFASFLKSRGILVRNRSKGARPTDNVLWGCVRISVGTDEENQQLLDAIDEFNQNYAVVFDLDGTLVDTSKSFDLTIAELVERHSGKPLPAEELRNLRAEGGFNNDWVAIAELLKRRGKPLPFEQVEKEALETYFRLAPVNEKLTMELTLIEKLAQRHPLFIVTGRTRPEYAPLWAKTFDGVFKQVYCDGDCQKSKPKPAPDYLLKVTAEHKLDHGVYIGDSVDDMAAAKSANMRRIGISFSMKTEALIGAGAELVLESPNDLAKVFQI
jgi:histidinol-phosphate aminotransferase